MALTLKTDYKDWVPGANGMQYDIGSTTQGHSSITDVTTYTQTGDEWSASILNRTNAAVNKLSRDVDSGFEKSTADINALDNKLTAYVDSVLWRLNHTRNPITGERSHYEDVLAELYELHREGALTAGEYDQLGLPAAIYENYMLTAREYDTSGKNILEPWVDENLAITTAEYDALGLTTQQFEEYNMTCVDYDFYAKRILGI